MYVGIDPQNAVMERSWPSSVRIRMESEHRMEFYLNTEWN